MHTEPSTHRGLRGLRVQYLGERPRVRSIANGDCLFCPYLRNRGTSSLPAISRWVPLKANHSLGTPPAEVSQGDSRHGVTDFPN